MARCTLPPHNTSFLVGVPAKRVKFPLRDVVCMGHYALMRQSMRIAIFAAATIAMGLAGLASAGGLDEHTSCAYVRSVLDAEAPSKPAIREIADYIEWTLKAQDRMNAIKGGGNIIGRLSPEGLNNIVATVTVRCGDHLNETVEQSVMFVYEGLRAMNEQFGLDKPD